VEEMKNNMNNNDTPVNVQQRQQPIIATDRWRISDGKLTKCFSFFQEGHRDKFIADILHYEKLTQHNAIITIFGDDVKLKLFTKGIDIVTHADKSYASYLDVSYREIIYIHTPHPDLSLEDDIENSTHETQIRMNDEFLDTDD
jgi:pterin-4a-carbinolamine dehydratase